MVDSHCEILLAKNLGAGSGRNPTVDYGSEADTPEKQAIISPHRLRYNMLWPRIKNFLTTDDKRKLRDFRATWTFNIQEDGSIYFCHFENGAPWHTRRILWNQDRSGNHEDVSVQTRYILSQPTNFGIDKQYLYCWRNLFRNFGWELQPILHLLMPTLQGLYGYQ